LLRSIRSAILEVVTPNPDIAVSLLDESASRDAGLVDQLNALINGVYASAERGLWRDGATRTTPTEIAELIAAGQVAVATTRDGHIVGSVHVHQVSDDAGEFGMLVAAPDHRGIGIGRHLIDFAEHYSRQRRLRAIQLELLVPRAGRHPGKEFLKSWYARRGYRLIHTRSIDETHPHLAPLLATPCDLEVHEKPLHRQGTTAPRRPPTFGVILPRAAARRLAAGRSFSATAATEAST
jgi:GNAT superfamily N-acetyltransferase